MKYLGLLYFTLLGGAAWAFPWISLVYLLLVLLGAAVFTIIVKTAHDVGEIVMDEGDR